MRGGLKGLQSIHAKLFQILQKSHKSGHFRIRATINEIIERII